MTNKKFWTPKDVENYLKQIPKGEKLILPDNVYCTENFTWNEILMTNNRNIDLPSLEILENINNVTGVLQKYRDRFKQPITITSSWRTPSEQKRLIDLYNKGIQVNKPSETSLHLEGLALDFSTDDIFQKDLQNLIDETLFGEMEFSTNYTHIGLPTFSENYLKRHGLYRNDLYKQLYDNSLDLSLAEQQKIIKRMNAKDWSFIPSKFNKQKNNEIFNINNNNSQHKFINLESKPFTREEIAKMTPEEFVKNENLIMEQMKNNQIKSAEKIIDYENYKNPETGKTRIFTREDIKKMSVDEYSKHEKESLKK